MVALRFNEAVTPSLVRLIDADGRTRGDAVVRSEQETVLIALPDNLPHGTQVISYRIISQDGHPVVGSMLFSIGGATQAKAVRSNTDSFSVLIWLARVAVYIGLFAGIGGVFFNIWIARAPNVVTPIRTALAIGLVGATASLGFQGLDLLDLSLGDLLTPITWTTALGTSLGPSLLAAMVAMVTALSAQSGIRSGRARALSLSALVLVGVSLAASGHASSASPQWLTRPSVFVHGVTVAFWVGALVPLAAMTRGPVPVLLSVLNRFSVMAVPVVGVLVLTGLTLAVIQLQNFGALIETSYGLILSTKLVLVFLLLALAAYNRFRLTPRLAVETPSRRLLFRSIATECILAVAILMLVAGWRFVPPPRALAAAASTPLAVHIHTENAMFQVLIAPGTAGSNSFVLQLMTSDGAPMAAQEATLTLSLPERGIEPFERRAALGKDGYWHVADVALPFAGRWHLRIDALVTDFQKVTLEDDFDVAAR